MRNPSFGAPMRRIGARTILIALVLAFALFSAIAVAPGDTRARSLPLHCDSLIQGDCDNPWQCIVACFMELVGLDEFCRQHPYSPQCM